MSIFILFYSTVTYFDHRCQSFMISTVHGSSRIQVLHIMINRTGTWGKRLGPSLDIFDHNKMWIQTPTGPGMRLSS